MATIQINATIICEDQEEFEHWQEIVKSPDNERYQIDLEDLDSLTIKASYTQQA